MKKVFFFFVLVLLFPQTSSAGLGDISLLLIPSHPSPQENYQVLISGLSDSSKIIWGVDGKTVSSGYEKSLSLIAERAGGRSVVSAQIEMAGAVVLEKTITVIPAGVTLITKAESVVPPFYKGKALVSPEGKITIIALPEMKNSLGRKIDSPNIAFTWKKEGLVVQGASGVGKNTYTFTSDGLPGNTTQISVIATSLSERIVAESKISPSPAVPKLFFYERTPLSGTVFERVINEGLDLFGDETEIVAYPYFMEPQGLFGADGKLSWSINGKTLEEREYSANTIRIRRPTTRGQSLLGFSVQDTKRVFSEARGSLLIHY